MHQDVLAIELRRTHKELPYEDRITVHRKGIPGHEEDEPLAHELCCFPNTKQVPSAVLQLRCNLTPSPQSEIHQNRIAFLER